jgi:hypothetical protein
MKVYLSAVFLLIAGYLMSSNPAFAHHGGSMFDRAHPISLKGVVSNYEWANPHVMIYVDGKDDKGIERKWTIETRGGPNVLAKAGWTKDTIKAGDQLTFVGYPAKNGSESMRLQKIVMSNGMELYPGSE